jgi:zinc/manganese transport system permease protein
VPVRTLSLLFVVFLGLAVASVTLVTGALLVFSLLVAPAAAAQLLAVRTGRTIALAVVIGVLVVWVSLALAYYTLYPIGFFVTTLGFGVYLCAWVVRRLRSRAG